MRERVVVVDRNLSNTSGLTSQSEALVANRPSVCIFCGNLKNSPQAPFCDTCSAKRSSHVMRSHTFAAGSGAKTSTVVPKPRRESRDASTQQSIAVEGYDAEHTLPLELDDDHPNVRYNPSRDEARKLQADPVCFIGRGAARASGRRLERGSKAVWNGCCCWGGGGVSWGQGRERVAGLSCSYAAQPLPPVDGVAPSCSVIGAGKGPVASDPRPTLRPAMGLGIGHGGKNLAADKMDGDKFGGPPSYQTFPSIVRMRQNVCTGHGLQGGCLRATCRGNAQHRDETRCQLTLFSL